MTTSTIINNRKNCVQKIKNSKKKKKNLNKYKKNTKLLNSRISCSSKGINKTK